MSIRLGSSSADETAAAASGSGGGTIQRGNRKPSVYLGFEQGGRRAEEDETRL